jgi:S-adenosylmethionine-diacylgycerolhomoserine-N-methlytransferase
MTGEIARAPDGHGDHSALMDQVYRGQRHIYDATRKYFLFGRDRLIEELDCRPGQTVLEVGCGTGRNLHRIGRRWPGVALHGLDISGEMLKSADARLRGSAHLTLADAAAFEPLSLFGRDGFDRVVVSFTLSMIPEWEAALAQAARALAPGGSLHVVDFGDLRGLPSPARKALRGWLTHFHVTPRLTLVLEAVNVAAAGGMGLTAPRGPLGYYQIVRLTRRAG